MKVPKISVIIPVYNVEKYLVECLDSVINQTFRDIEVICVNDGSTDSSLSILKKYASKDNRIKIIDKENQGQGYARKIGLNNAQGDYILFLDSDDKYVDNNVFRKLYDYIDNRNFEVCIFDYSGFLEGKIEPQHYNYNKKNVIFKQDMWMCWNKIYRKSFIDKYSDWYFPIKHHLTQDVALHVQVLCRANKIGYMDNNCVLYRLDNSNSATRSKVNLKRMLAPCIYIRKTYEVIKNLLDDSFIIDEKKEQLKKEFIKFTITQLLFYIEIGENNNIAYSKYIYEYQKILLELKEKFNPFIKKNISNSGKFYDLNNSQLLFYKIMLKLSDKNLLIYIERKKLRNKNKIIKEKDCEINFLQNSFSYRIGLFITYPFIIIINFIKFIIDYNLIKKSDLFDNKYYLSQNEDVDRANIDPIKHYLKFGWKEGRNPSAKFDGNAYLNRKPYLKANNTCPLVHYLKFRKNER